MGLHDAVRAQHVASAADVQSSGREPVLITPDVKPPADMPDFDFRVRDALIDIRWGTKLAADGTVKNGNATVVRTADGNSIRCIEFRDLMS